MKDIKIRIEEYIEFAEATYKYSDVGFYQDVLDVIKSLESKLKEAEEKGDQ